MTQEDIIDMAIDAGATDCANPDKWGILEISFENLVRFAKSVAAQERRECEDEALTKNLVANWPYKKFVGLNAEDIADLCEKTDVKTKSQVETFTFVYMLIEQKLKEKNV